ncbi:MAG: hypothetical protein WC956_10395, partial [bacterium]
MTNLLQTFFQFAPGGSLCDFSTPTELAEAIAMQPEGDDTASSPDAADAGSSRTAQYQTLPLSTVAQLGQIGDRATFRPFRQ